MSFRIGPHIKKDAKLKIKTYIDALNRAATQMAEYGLKIGACQIYVMGPRDYHMTFTDEYAAEFGAVAKQMNVAIIVHSAYIVSPFYQLPEKVNNVIANIRRQLAMCDKMGAAGMVIHLPSPKITVAQIVERLVAFGLADFKTPLFLETNAIAPKPDTYDKIPRLDEMFTAIDAAGIGAHVGHCVDTAHMWSTATSFTTKHQASEWFTELSKISNGALWNMRLANGDSRIMLHLNDEQHDAGSGRDAHMPLTTGQIWSKDASGLVEIVRFCYTNGIIAILEINVDGGHPNDYKVLRQIMDGVAAS